MKDFFYSIFVWISGADTTLLKDCPESEHKKYALQGGLILIPTMMALVSMLYATSLLTDDINIRLLLAIGWAVIIFIIDRYIVATFIKTKTGKDWFSIQFFIRIIFAIGLGIVISHPVIIRVFDDKIQETQTEIWQSLKDTIEQDVFSKRDTDNEEFENRLSELIGRVDTLDMVIAAEIVGANTKIGNYYVSNQLGKGTRVANYEKNRDSIKNEIIDLKNKIKNNTDSAYVKRDERIKEMEESLAKGYWGKDDALTIYLDKSKKWSKYLFILIFFIFVDVTAVLLKVFTHYGEYDEKLAQRQSNRITHKANVWVGWLRKKQRLIDKDCEWTEEKIDEIFDGEENYDEIKKNLAGAGISFDEKDKEPDEKNIFEPIIREIKTLPQEKYFKVFSIISIIIGVFNACLIYIKGGNQINIIDGALSSMMQSFVVTLFGTIFANLITHRINRQPQTTENN